MKNVIKEWWFWVVLATIIFVIVGIIIIYLDVANELADIRGQSKEDNTDLTSFEVIEYLEDKGYTFETDDLTNIYTTHYIILRNDDEGIWIQKVINELIGTMLNFKNEQINEEFADMTSESANATKEEQQQYDAYINWLDDMGLTKMQIVEALDFYDEMQN